jgi:hypothetical protein
LEEWISLIRVGYPRNETIYLSDLDTPKVLPKLVSPKLPELSKTIMEARSNMMDPFWVMALKNIASMRSPEGLFWDRLFMEFKRLLGDPVKACESTLLRLSRKDDLSLPRMEFGGLLTPLKDLEELTSERAVDFLSNYIRSWRSNHSRKGPRGTAPLWLSTDLYNSSRIFRIPFTYLSLITQLHFETSGKLPGILEVYSGTRTVLSLVNMVKRVWNEERPPICDLEETVRLFPIFQKNPQLFQQRYMALIDAFRAANRGKTTLF